LEFFHITVAGPVHPMASASSHEVPVVVKDETIAIVDEVVNEEVG